MVMETGFIILVDIVLLCVLRTSSAPTAIPRNPSKPPTLSAVTTADVQTFATVERTEKELVGLHDPGPKPRVARSLSLATTHIPAIPVSTTPAPMTPAPTAATPAPTPPTAATPTPTPQTVATQTPGPPTPTPTHVPTKTTQSSYKTETEPQKQTGAQGNPGRPTPSTRLLNFLPDKITFMLSSMAAVFVVGMVVFGVVVRSQRKVEKKSMQEDADLLMAIAASRQASQTSVAI